MYDTKYSLLLIILFLLSGCAKNAVSSIKNEPVAISSYIPVLRQFQARIDGVECSVCAEDVVSTIKTLEGVDCADFVLTGTDYEDGYVRFYYDVHTKNIDVHLLNVLLEKQGFELFSLCGAFYIEPFSVEGKKFIALNDEIAMPFYLNDNIEAFKQMISMHPERLFAEGVIKKDLQEDAYAFTFLGKG